MDTYENQFPENEEILQSETAQQEDTWTQAQPDESAACAKKASPFADSPYVVNGTYDAPEKPAKKKKSNKKFWKAALCCVFAVALVACACVATAFVVDDLWEERMERMSEQFEDQLEAISKQAGSGGVTIIPGGSTADGKDILTPSQVYALNVQSVVMIYNKVTTAMYGQSAAATSTGSGFILSADGYVVTNYHVVEGNGEITVETNSGEQYKATIVGYDDLNDVALLKVEASDLSPVTLGNSDDLIVGDQVVAIGNPLGELTSTLTVGYISAKERDVNTSGFAVNMLQTDAAINSGNSGGPLFNMQGQVIGITTAKYSGTSSSGASIEGVGFAIPIDDVKDLLDDLTTNATSAYLGVSVSDLNADAAAYMGITTGGAYVEEVVDGFCAKKAGVQVKDIIVELGDYDVSNVSELTKVLRKFEAGETTTITVYRSGQKLELEITLDEKPAQVQQPTQEQTFPSETPEGDFDDWYEYFSPFFGQ